MKTKFLKCPGCGHIHVGVAEADAADEVRTMAEYLTRLEPAERQRSYGDRTPSIDDYKKCHRCGTSSETFTMAIGYENSSMTMQPVIAPNLKPSTRNNARRPIIFLDLDDVLAINPEFNSYQVIAAIKARDLDWPELWAGLILDEARANLAALHAEFWPQYVVSSSWSVYLTREQMRTVFLRSGLDFVAKNMHKQWTTPKRAGPSRVTEITDWIAAHPARPVLILDDRDSGWSLWGSALEDSGYVVLCGVDVGFVAEKFADAQRLLRAQRQE